MNEEILVHRTPQETRVAMVQQGVVQELHVERTLERGYVGNLYLGQVTRILPGIQSAFINIGLERTAFLHVVDIWRPRVSTEVPDSTQAEASETARPSPSYLSSISVPPIEKMLFEGQMLMVQILKDPMGAKGARLSTQISIAGRTLVYLPQETNIGISQKIDGDAHREAIRARLYALLPPDETGGYIVRTSAESATDQELANDIAYLRKAWQTISKQSQLVTEPCLLHQDLTLAQRVLRDFSSEHTARIVIDPSDAFQSLNRFAAEFTPALQTKLHQHTGEQPLFEHYNVESEIQRALEKRVNLKSGGYLVIDQTEAMTTIDVNTGGYVGNRNSSETIFKTNLEAASTLARQLRLRNLGGIIVIDFIDMERAEQRETVLNELKKALSPDRARISVNNFSELGVVEMTRKRTRESLAHMLCESCPTCSGKGFVKTARTLCYEIMREIEREARQFNPQAFRILAAQPIIDLFLDEESHHLALLCDLIEKPVSLQTETHFHQEQYEIVLM